MPFLSIFDICQRLSLYHVGKFIGTNKELRWEYHCSTILFTVKYGVTIGCIQPRDFLPRAKTSEYSRANITPEADNVRDIEFGFFVFTTKIGPIQSQLHGSEELTEELVSKPTSQITFCTHFVVMLEESFSATEHFSDFQT